MLNLDAINKAYAKLKNNLKYCASYENSDDTYLLEMMKSAAIQSFEFTYELAVKIIRRQMIEFESSATIEQLSFKELIRSAARKGLIQTPEEWFNFRTMRNVTSHTQDESKADDIFNKLPIVENEVKFLLDKLVEINAPKS